MLHFYVSFGILHVQIFIHHNILGAIKLLSFLVNHIIYADHLVMLSPRSAGLQHPLTIQYVLCLGFKHGIIMQVRVLL